MTTLTTQASVLRATRRLAREVGRLALDTPSHVYNASVTMTSSSNQSSCAPTHSPMR